MDNEPERPKLSQQYRQPPKTATKNGSVLMQSRTDQLIKVERRRREQHAQDQASGRSIDAFANRDDTPEPETGGATSAVEPPFDRQSSQALTFSSFLPPDPPNPPDVDMATNTPAAAPVNNYSLITITPRQLQELVQQTIQATQAAAPQGNPPGPQITNITKDLRIPDPSPFSRHSDELDPDDKKVFYILSLFKGKLARIWKEQFLKSREGQDLVAVDIVGKTDASICAFILYI